MYFNYIAKQFLSCYVIYKVKFLKENNVLLIITAILNSWLVARQFKNVTEKMGTRLTKIVAMVTHMLTPG